MAEINTHIFAVHCHSAISFLEVERTILSLSTPEKEITITHLTPSDKSVHLSAVEAVQDIRIFCLEAIGIDIFQNTKRWEVVSARAIVATKLLASGYSRQEVAEALHKERTTLYHYEKIVEGLKALPAMDAGAYKLYKMIEEWKVLK